MTLRETANCLIKWVESSTNEDHLKLLNELIDPFIINRFRGDMELAHEVAKILLSMQRQSSIIMGSSISELVMN